MPARNGLPLGRHREIGLDLARIRDRLAAIADEVSGGWPRRTRVVELAQAVTGPIDALRAELDTRARAEHPAATADLYYSPADVRGIDPRRDAERSGRTDVTSVLGYEWKLREVMALRGMFKTTDLIGPLAERGITRDRTQIYRIVAERPKQVDIVVLLALCDILDCQLTDLAAPMHLPGTAS